MSKKEKSKDNKKKFSKGKIFLITFLVLLIVLGASAYLIFKPSTLPTKKAYVTSIVGDVEVNTDGEWRDAVKGEELSLDTSVKTGANSNVTLVMHGKAFVDIGENSQVKILSLAKEKLLLKQDKGSTWNKLRSMAGATDYEVKTPNGVASVRGTDFKVTLTQNKSSDVLVAEGSVMLSNEKGENLTVESFEKASVSEDKIEKSENLTKQELKEVVARYKREIERLKEERWKLIQAQQPLLSIVKRKYDLTDEKIREYLTDIDEGRLDDEKLVEKSPYKPEVIDDLLEINDQIKSAKKDLEEVENKTSK